MTPYHDQQQGWDVPGKPFNLSSEGTIQRVNLLVGSTNLFPRINTLPRPAWATRSRRDNLSMRERWCRQSQHARALFTWAKGVNFSSHINARLGSMTRLGGWPFYPGRVFSIQTGPQGPPGVCLRISARRRGEDDDRDRYNVSQGHILSYAQFRRSIYISHVPNLTQRSVNNRYFPH